jgi:hypothetical protein
VGTDTAVLVEDCVSGIVCSRHADAYALCGTNLHDVVLRHILRGAYSRVVVFLDDDNSTVQSKQREAARKLSLLFPTVSIHHSGGRDPKEHSDAELRRIL